MRERVDLLGEWMDEYREASDVVRDYMLKAHEWAERIVKEKKKNQTRSFAAIVIKTADASLDNLALHEIFIIMRRFWVMPWNDFSNLQEEKTLSQVQSPYRPPYVNRPRVLRVLSAF